MRPPVPMRDLRLRQLERTLHRLENPDAAILAAGCESHPETPYGLETTLVDIIAAELKAVVEEAKK